MAWLRSTFSQLRTPSSSFRARRSSTDGARDVVLLEGREGRASSTSGSALLEPWRSTSHRGRISRELRNSTEFRRRWRCVGDPGEGAAGGGDSVVGTATGTARERPGDSGGRRKCRGTAVGDSVMDRAVEWLRPRVMSSPAAAFRVASGEEGLLWDFGAKSRAVLSAAGGDVERLRGRWCKRVSPSARPAAERAAPFANDSSPEAPRSSRSAAAGISGRSPKKESSRASLKSESFPSCTWNNTKRNA